MTVKTLTRAVSGNTSSRKAPRNPFKRDTKVNMNRSIQAMKEKNNKAKSQ